MNPDLLAIFLRARRESIRPEDVGLIRGPRRRAPGLRREEVAQLCGMSPDYLARLERGARSRPSQPMAAAIARGLRLTPAERDHLFLLCEHSRPRPDLRDQYVSPALLRVMDQLRDTPAQVIGPTGDRLGVTPVGVALLGDDSGLTGRARSVFYRWFTDPRARDRYFAEDHEFQGRLHVAFLRASVSVHGPRSAPAAMVWALRRDSPEFAELWGRPGDEMPWSSERKFRHPEVGRVELFCQTLTDPDRAQFLLVFTATPGSDSYDKVALLNVLGPEAFPGGL